MPLSKKLEIFIQGLILLSVTAFTIETLPNLSEEVKQYLYLFEITTVSIFTIEYLTRIFCSKKKVKFIFSFYGIIDLLAILPFFLALGVDLRAIRVLRLFKIFRMFKLLRYSKALDRYAEAFKSVKNELALFGFSSIIIIYLSSIGIYYFEHAAQPDVFKSVPHAFWWAITTLTTVGYGDMYPITTGGRIFTFFVLGIGLAIVAVPTALISAALTESKKMDKVIKQQRKNKLIYCLFLMMFLIWYFVVVARFDIFPHLTPTETYLSFTEAHKAALGLFFMFALALVLFMPPSQRKHSIYLKLLVIIVMLPLAIWNLQIILMW